MCCTQLLWQVPECTSAALRDIPISKPSAVQLAVKYHPDKAKGDRAQAEEKFKDLSSAYATLSGELNTYAEVGRTPKCLLSAADAGHAWCQQQQE